MTLLAPWALWFAAIGAGVIALYILKIKRRQQNVPALDFWRELAGRTKVHSLFERLRRLLSMLLWLIIAACLVLALGNPILSLGAIKPRAIALVIDNSASMQSIEAESGSKSRLELARETVNGLTTRRPVNDEWMLIEAAREPRVLQAWTHEKKPVQKAAQDLQPFNGTGALSAAVELAGQLLAGKPDPCIVVITDGAAGTVAQLTQSDAKVIYWPIGKTQDNLGISRLSVRLQRQQSAHHVFVSVVNSSADKIETQLTLQIDGVSNSVELISVEGNGAWEKTLVIDAPTGGVLRASIDRSDALALDNEAFAVLEPIRPAIVWLVTPDEESFFFEQALASMDPLVWADESLTLSPESYEKAVADKELKKPDLVIFNDCTPKALPDVVGGQYIMVNAWPSEVPAKSTGMLAAPQLFIAPKPHPLTQYLNLQGVRLKEAHRVSLTEHATVLAHSADADPLIFLCQQRHRQMLCLAFDVLESDLPFRNAFPLLLRNAVAFMYSERPSLTKSDYHIGEIIQPLTPLPEIIKEVQIASMRDGKTQDSKLAVHDSRFAWTDTGQVGALRISYGDESCYTAINLADPDESRIAPTPTLVNPTEQLALSDRLFGTMPWIGFAAIACALIALEWLTFNFRWTE